jgi:hypothetical protein
VLLLLSLLLLLPSLLPRPLCRNGGRLGSKVALLPVLTLVPAAAPLLAAAAAVGEVPQSSDNAPGGCATGEEPRLWQRRLQPRKSTAQRKAVESDSHHRQFRLAKEAKLWQQRLQARKSAHQIACNTDAVVCICNAPSRVALHSVQLQSSPKKQYGNQPDETLTCHGLRLLCAQPYGTPHHSSSMQHNTKAVRHIHVTH